MHEASYIVGTLGGLLMTGYIYCKERDTVDNNSIAHLEPNGISINLIHVFSK